MPQTYASAKNFGRFSRVLQPSDLGVGVIDSNHLRFLSTKTSCFRTSDHSLLPSSTEKSIASAVRLVGTIVEMVRGENTKQGGRWWWWVVMRGEPNGRRGSSGSWSRQPGALERIQRPARWVACLTAAATGGVSESDGLESRTGTGLSWAWAVKLLYMGQPLARPISTYVYFFSSRATSFLR